MLDNPQLLVFVPGIPSNTNKSGHFGSGKWQTVGERAKFRKLTKEIAEQAIAESDPPWVMPSYASITAVHCSPVRRRRDPLGLAERLKSIMDGLVDAHVIPDDDEEHIRVFLNHSIKSDIAGIQIVITALEKP